MSELVPDSEHVPANLLADVRALIEEARRQTSAAVNVGMTLTYWRVGQRIRVDVLGGTRAAYGEHIVSTLSRQLTADDGRSFSQTVLPPPEVRREKMHAAIRSARARIDAGSGEE